MYHGGESKKRANPQEKANFFSLITFFYAFPLLRKGARKDIEERDIYEVIPKLQSSTVGEHLEKQWLLEKSTHRDSPSLFRVLWRCYGKYYLSWGMIQLCVKIAMLLIQPKALARLVSYFTATSTMPKSEAVYYACLVVGLNLLNSTYSHNYQMVVTELAIRVRTAFCSLIYRKALKLGPSALSDITIGKIVTLISKDVNSFDSAIIFLNDMWISVIIIIMTTWLIFTQLGIATFAGMGFVILLIPFQVYVGRITSLMRITASKITDRRLQLAQETISAIKIIKMYTWEKLFGDLISKSREEEMRKINNIYYTKAVSIVLGSLIINITLYIIVVTYTNLGNYFTAEKAFFLISCLQTLRPIVMGSIPMGIVQTAELVASLRRINTLLTAQELFQPRRSNDNSLIHLEGVDVNIKTTPILHHVTLKLMDGLNIVTGRVGGGKSSLLKTILSDYPTSRGQVKVHGSISYASEAPWLFPSTIRQNIIFGEPLDFRRYQKVLEVCALKMDIATFDQGDETIVDDRGMNLSKGQQARVNLARAVYRDCDIYLLDDCLSSLDAHVQDFVFNECVRKFLGNKLVVMISQNEHHIKQADHVIVMEGGTVKCFTTPEEVPEIAELIQEEPPADDIDKVYDEVEAGQDQPLIKTNANIYHEKKKEGTVDINVYLKYCRFGGGLLLLGGIFLIFLIAQFASTYSDKLIASWSNVQQKISEIQLSNGTNTTKYEELLVSNAKVLSWYTGAIVLSTVLLLLRAFAHFRFSSRASVKLHNTMVLNILNATMQFFDLNYIGNVLNRFSKDLGGIDEYLPFVIYECLRLVCLISGIIIVISSVNWIFLIPATIILIVLFQMRKFYISTGRSLKRLDSATRSPVLGHINASLEGLTTIRAWSNQSILQKEFDKHQDLYTSANYMMICTSRLFAYSLDILCNIFIAIIVFTFLIMDKETQAGNVGLAITQAFMLIGLLQWAIRQWAELESQMTAVERVLEYTTIKEENKSGNTLENWPSEGAITYFHVNLTYGNSKELVLKDLTFRIDPKQKIGIVGRTGAGKSSIISTLFRLYSSDGIIYIDDVDIKSLSLSTLRSRIAIIPQDPILFTGSIRTNIDPSGKFGDSEIWKALERVHLNGLVSSLDQGIVEGGVNFSAGQKQLICLARALITNNRIIILDEATANMDSETDALIYTTIQESFQECTVLTIAHRLHSVLKSDKVMVLDKGRIVEYDKPDVLLENEDGVFYKMVKQANLL